MAGSAFATVPALLPCVCCCCALRVSRIHADGNIPPQLYVRISNRLVGEFVMTQNNICVPNEAQSIALGDWSFDEHMTGKYAVPNKEGDGYTVMLEGNFWPSVGAACDNPKSADDPEGSHDAMNV